MLNRSILDKIRSGVCAIGYLRGAPKDYINDFNNFIVMGTGFLVRKTTVITNRHVMEDLKQQREEAGLSDDQLFVQFVYPVGKGKWQQTFRKFGSAGIIEGFDLAFIEFKRAPESQFEQCIPLKLGDVSTISTGFPVGILGYPHGEELLNVKIFNSKKQISDQFNRFGPVLNQGYISAISPLDGTAVIDRILLDINSGGGMSGSPVFKLDDGTVIGIFYAGNSGIGMGFALPLDVERVNKWLKVYDQSRPTK